MNPRAILFVFTFISTTLSGHAERTKGITRIYLHPGKEVSFILYSDVPIECGGSRGPWQSVVLYLPSTAAYFSGDKKPQNADPLLDSRGRKVGYIASDKLDFTPQRDVVDGSYSMRLAGYIADSNINASSVPEHQLEQLIISTKGHLTLEVCQPLLTDLRFQRHKKNIDAIEEANPELHSYVLYFDSYIGGPTIFRLQLLFQNDQLVAVFHGRTLAPLGYKDRSVGRNNHLLWLGKPDDPEFNRLLRSYQKLYGGIGVG